MKKMTVDYKNFRPSKINDPPFSHLKLLLSWPVYFAMYFLTENFIPVEKCYVIHSPLDDYIPFCEFFVIPYVFWYALIAGSLLYFLLYNVESFKKLQIYIIITQIAAMAVYIIFPNVQNLRPETFVRDNIFTDIINLLYTLDTNTNVFPSLHVAYSIGIVSIWTKEKAAPLGVKLFVVISAILICLSTAFIKQHSVLDGFAALPVCLTAEFIVYGKYYRSKLTKNKA